MKPRFSKTTAPNRRGISHHFLIEDHGALGFMAQLVSGSLPDPNGLHSETIVLDHFPTLEKACDALGYPYDIAGLPILK